MPNTTALPKRPFVTPLLHIVILLTVAMPVLGQPDAFRARYPGSGEGVVLGETYRPTPSDADVWRLTTLPLRMGESLSIDVGPCSVVIGAVDGNALWAYVLPDEPPTLHSALAGDGASVRSVSLCFHPTLFSELLPAGAVEGPGPIEALPRAQREYSAKIPTTFGQGDHIKAQPESYVVVDVETTEPKRRLYAIDLGAGQSRYIAQLEDTYLAPVTPVTEEEALAAFDEVWQAYDAEYAMFVIKPDVDWAALGEEYRPLAAKARDAYALGLALAGMLGRLEDLHAWVILGQSEHLPVYDRPRPLNGSPQALGRYVPDLTDLARGLAWGRAEGDIGYIAVFGLRDESAVALFDEALEDLRDTDGLVLDIRFNGGGNEALAQRMVGRLVDETRVYAGQRFRDGPAHDDLTDPTWRTLEPVGLWRYDRPIVALWGRRTMSSAEAFALMLTQCPQVTTMGDRTAGASGNPRFIELPGGLRVSLPRWLALDADGNPFEGLGIAPDVTIEAAPEDFTAVSDPVLEQALARLRQR